MDLEDLIRISVFALVFAAMASWEIVALRRALAVGRRPRWASNLGILAVDVLAVVDVTTGGRFHPFEILISSVVKIATVVAVGIPAVAVLVFEVVLNATSMFNHSNVAMPPSLDRLLRLLVVTPDMHRVHHSILRRETDSNFGFNLPWWDRLFGTYRAAPEAGHAGMTVGLPIFRDQRELRMDRLLTQPFRDDVAGAAPGG